MRDQLGISARTLASWVKAGLFTAKEEYAAEEVRLLRKLQELREAGVPNATLVKDLVRLRESYEGGTDVLRDMRLELEGKHLRLRGKGAKVDVKSRQFLLDFDAEEVRRLLSFPAKAAEPKKNSLRDRAQAEVHFQRALELEQVGADKREAIAEYQAALALCPDMAGALVNIGTIYFNARKWREAERFYQKALEADEKYPLAHFNLANLHEELGRTSLAIQHYKRAIELYPAYADAHYNLALLYQTRERAMEALRHWKLYLQFDKTSHWAAVARREMNRLKEAALVRGNFPTSSTESA
ncbi:MAG: tetratricopeptide repeat protein [Bryobacter sp.]|nr:tetratricopeptide repeat protein [Bryobacter sp.]